MKNFVVSSRIFKDENGKLCMSYDEDVMEMFNKLNLSINSLNIANKLNNNLLKNYDGLFLWVVAI